MTNHSSRDAGDFELPPWSSELELEAMRGAASAGVGNLPQAEPLSMASVWQMDSPASAEAAIASDGGEFVYRRLAHPNARSLEQKLATLHGARRALVTAQGMSAISGLALAMLRPRSTVWIGEELYGETSQLFTRDLARWAVTTRVFDPCNASQVAELADAKADLVFIETITNPRLKVADISAVATAAHRANGLLVVDNTFATHLLCRPLELGADFVVESLSKQVSGHSDTMLGLVCGRDESSMSAVAGALKAFGMASSPLDCFLTHRGLMSLAVRMERACANALALATVLADLKSVRLLDYPGWSKHPSFDIARRQLRGGYGWMLSFHVDLDRAGVTRLFEAFRPEICFAPSLGDVNTTISHPVSTSHRGASKEVLSRLGIDEGTIRISCGIEPTDWLVDRFRSVLNALAAG